MPTLGRFRRELRWRFWSVPVEREVDSELAFHLDMRIRELVEQGMTPDDARATALTRFGDVDRITEACRDIGRRRNKDMRRAEWLTELRHDLRYALRGLRASPGFTAVAVLTLAMGIGASTTIFSVANAVLLRPFPYHEPKRIVRLYETNPTTDLFSVSEPNYLDWLQRVRGLSQMAAFTGGNLTLLGDGDPEELSAMAATPSLFPLLGVRPLIGRVFREEESKPGAPARVILFSYAFWQTRFGADPQVVGRTVNLNGTSYEVIGVMPPEFVFPGNPALWEPLAPSATLSRGETPRGDRRLAVLGRLAPNVTIARALDELKSVARDLARQYPETNRGWGANVTSLEEWLIGDELRTRVQVLLVAVGLLLAMGCVNVANLLLARATARQREMSVRAALGAGRGRIVRQLLTESLVLAAIGAALGVALTVVAVPILRDVGQTAIPRLDELDIDWQVVAFGIVASVVTGILFGIAPALQASRADLNDVLRSGGRVAAASRLRSILIVTSVALALVLLVGAGLVGRSFERLMRVDYGFRAEGVFTASVTLPVERYRQRAKLAAFYAEVARRLSTTRGIRAVGFTNIAPFSGGSTAIQFTVAGQAARADEYLSAHWRLVTPGYFPAIGVALKKGRLIAESDGAEAPRVVVITETMARQIWPGMDPVGQQIRLGGNDGPTWTVVGIVGDIRDQLLQQEPQPMMYLSFQQLAWQTMWLIVRGTGDPLALAPVVRREIHAIDPLMPVANEQPLERFVSAIAAQPRFTTLIFALFASAALVLAVVGVYGIVAYGVTQRTREFGVRLALGATPSRIVMSVVRYGVGLAGFGIAIGLWAAYALSRFVQGILYEVTATDAVTYLAVAALLIGCAAAASILPARWAARLDPVRALRDD